MLPIDYDETVYNAKKANFYNKKGRIKTVTKYIKKIKPIILSVKINDIIPSGGVGGTV